MGELTTQNERNLTLMVSLLVPVCAGLSEFDEVMGLTTQQLQSSIIKLGLRNGKWKNSEKNDLRHDKQIDAQYVRIKKSI